MIVFDLSCRNGHVFEAWFRDGAAFEAQRKARKVACPDCGDHRVKKAPMAPRIGASAPEATPTKAVTPPSNAPAEMMQALRKLRQHVETNCDYVGPRFAEEARKIHYGERSARGIYGEASEAEAKSLSEEGIEVARIPWLPREDA
jgi:hypothetical protein